MIHLPEPHIQTEKCPQPAADLVKALLPRHWQTLPKRLRAQTLFVPGAKHNQHQENEFKMSDETTTELTLPPNFAQLPESEQVTIASVMFKNPAYSQLPEGDRKLLEDCWVKPYFDCQKAQRDRRQAEREAELAALRLRIAESEAQHQKRMADNPAITAIYECMTSGSASPMDYYGRAREAKNDGGHTVESIKPGTSLAPEAKNDGGYTVESRKPGTSWVSLLPLVIMLLVGYIAGSWSRVTVNCGSCCSVGVST
ncbi:hypothetical protein DFS34DRAFT_260069 [Phlyctochytrium arcticum]|nr:hypothetical protein DFS34DRAFT_260069 [Phlyctochytrium arcticum]